MRRILFLVLCFLGAREDAGAKQWIVFCSEKEIEHAYLAFIKEAPGTNELVEKTLGFGPVDITAKALIGTAGTIYDNSYKTARYYFMVEVDEKEYDLCWQVRLKWDRSDYILAFNDCLSFMEEVADQLKGRIKVPGINVLDNLLPSEYVSRLIEDNQYIHQQSLGTYREAKRNYVLLSAYSNKSLYTGWSVSGVGVRSFGRPQSPNCVLTAESGSSMFSTGRTYEYNGDGVLVKETELGLKEGSINKIFVYTYSYNNDSSVLTKVASVDDLLLGKKYTVVTQWYYSKNGAIVERRQTSDDINAPYTTTERYAYNLNGKLVVAKRVENDQIIQENKYDQGGRLIEVRYSYDKPERSTVHFEYDELGREKYIKANGVVIGYRNYDGLGRIIEEKGVNNSIEYHNRYSYSGNKLASVLSFEAELTEFIYDEKGVLTSSVKYTVKNVGGELVKERVEERSTFDEYGNLTGYEQDGGDGVKAVYKYLCR